MFLFSVTIIVLPRVEIWWTRMFESFTNAYGRRYWSLWLMETGLWSNRSYMVHVPGSFFRGALGHGWHDFNWDKLYSTLVWISAIISTSTHKISVPLCICLTLLPKHVDPDYRSSAPACSSRWHHRLYSTMTFLNVSKKFNTAALPTSNINIAPQSLHTGKVHHAAIRILAHQSWIVVENSANRGRLNQ